MLQSRTPSAGKSLLASTAPWINLVPYGSSWQKSCWNFWSFKSFLGKRGCLESAWQRDIGACVVLIAVKSASWHALAQELVPVVTVLAWVQELWVPSGVVAIPTILTTAASQPCLGPQDLYPMDTALVTKGQPAHNSNTESFSQFFSPNSFEFFLFKLNNFWEKRLATGRYELHVLQISKGLESKKLFWDYEISCNCFKENQDLIWLHTL